MKAEAVKYLVGLKLCEVGIKNYLDLADRLGITPQYLSLILATRERPAKHQRAIARICRCTAQELFGEFTSPELRAELSTPTSRRKS